MSLGAPSSFACGLSLAYPHHLEKTRQLCWLAEILSHLGPSVDRHGQVKRFLSAGVATLSWPLSADGFLSGDVVI